MRRRNTNDQQTHAWGKGDFRRCKLTDFLMTRFPVYYPEPGTFLRTSSYPLLSLEVYPKETAGDVGESSMAKSVHCSLTHNSRKIGNETD